MIIAILDRCSPDVPKEQQIENQIEALQKFGNRLTEIQAEETFVMVSEPQEIPKLGFTSAFVLRINDTTLFNAIVPSNTHLNIGDRISLYRFANKGSQGGLNEFFVIFPK